MSRNDLPSFGQVIVRLDELEPRCLADALAQQVGMGVTEEHGQAVTRSGRLNDLGADDDVAPIPFRPVIGARLLLARAEYQQRSFSDVTEQYVVGMVGVTKQGEKTACPENLVLGLPQRLALGYQLVQQGFFAMCSHKSFNGAGVGNISRVRCIGCMHRRETDV